MRVIVHVPPSIAADSTRLRRIEAAVVVALESGDRFEFIHPDH